MDDATREKLNRIPKEVQENLLMMLNLPIGSQLPRKLVCAYDETRHFLDTFYPDRRQVVFTTGELALMCQQAGCQRRPQQPDHPKDPLDRVDAARRNRFAELVEGDIVDVQLEGDENLTAAAFVRMAPDGRVVVRCDGDDGEGFQVTLQASRVSLRAPSKPAGTAA